MKSGGVVGDGHPFVIIDNQRVRLKYYEKDNKDNQQPACSIADVSDGDRGAGPDAGRQDG